MQRSNFNLISLLMIVVLLGLLMAVLFPAVSVHSRRENMSTVASRGKDIYVAITSANVEREPLGLPNIWPQSNPPTTNAVDIHHMNFTNSTDYFWALYDGDHYGTDQHDPYVRGFDFSKLAGCGVEPHRGPGRLNPENNMWTIAKNVQDEMEDIIPVLVTRNVAAETLVTDLLTMSDRRLFFDEQWKTPFEGRGFVMIRKGGGTFTQTARYLTHRVVYNSQTFMTTIPGSPSPRLCYLTPNKEVMPSDAVYHACATANANTLKSYRYYWTLDNLKEGLKILIFILLVGLISGIFIFLRVFFDKQLKVPLSVMGPAYWLVLWLAVTLYMCFPVMLCLEYKFASILLTLVLAPVFQMVGCLYMVVWRRRSGNVETYRMAFGFVLLAPVIAFLCLLTAVVLFPVKYFLLMGLISALYLFIRVSDDKKLTATLSVMEPTYWILLWLAVTAYLCCLVMVFMKLDNLSLLPTFSLACMCQIIGCLYMVVWKRRTGNVETFRTALLAMVAAPVLAVACLIMAGVLVLVAQFALSFYYAYFAR